MLADLLVAVVPLFVVVDPFASLGLFLALTGRHDVRGRMLVALRATAFAAAVLVLFSFAGRDLLRALGIELYSLQIGGGLLLVLIGLRMLSEGEEVPQQEIVEAETGAKDGTTDTTVTGPATAGGAVPARRTTGGHAVATGGKHPTTTVGHDPSLVPLGLPMLAGPGAISQAIVQTTRFDAWVALAAILVAMAASLLVLLAAARASNVISENPRRVITRIMGLLTVAFAVQYVLDGFAGWMAR